MVDVIFKHRYQKMSRQYIGCVVTNLKKIDIARGYIK